MKLKNYFGILLLFLLLICCVSTINAVSDDGIAIDQNAEINSVSMDESNPEPIAVSQDETVLENTDEEVLREDSAATNLSPYD